MRTSRSGEAGQPNRVPHGAGVREDRRVRHPARGSVQLACARPDGLLDQLTGQDLLPVTGSAGTARGLRTHLVVVGNAVRFTAETAEADSLNCSILGPDAPSDSPEFAFFVDRPVTGMTVGAGQRCTAIRHAFVPSAVIGDVGDAVRAKPAEVTIGCPADQSVTVGALVSPAQRDDVRDRGREADRRGQARAWGSPQC